MNQPKVLDRSSQYDAVRKVAFAAVQAAVERNRKRLMKLANVIDVRAGFKFRDGWITDEPAIVVTVLNKKPENELKAEDIIPEVLDGIPVDVAPASPRQQLGAIQSRGAARNPVLEDEPLILPGTNGQSVTIETARDIARGASGHGYRKPDGLQLKAVTAAMNVTCHASPDAGWPTLKRFLAGTKENLTVAMYDFTAPHIFEALRGAIKKTGGKLLLSIDYSPNAQRRKDKMLEPEIVDGLAEALADNFEFTKAAVHVLYPNAYHIKVAVRDSAAFWLSSGNWQNSNQPPDDLSALDVSGQRKVFGSHNREWHVVIEHPGLAKLYENYIKFDMSESKRVAGQRGALPPEPELPDVLVPEDLLRAEERAAAQVKIFKPLTLKFTAAERLKIQPLLTPDNYHEHVRDLIDSATERIYIENQYIKPRTDSPQEFRELYEALARQMNKGLDVRIILRREGDVRVMIESLKTVDIPTDADHLRLLTGCHNKGIIVDSQTVVVGSHNWSGDGTVFNRDASLILFDPKSAAYFEKIFLHDWDNRAKPFVPSERGAVPVVAAPSDSARAATPPGMRRLSWREFYGE